MSEQPKPRGRPSSGLSRVAQNAKRRQAMIEAGGEPINGVLPPDVAQALRELLEFGYGSNKLDAIGIALLQFRQSIRKSRSGNA